jgi:hypothetical protein
MLEAMAPKKVEESLAPREGRWIGRPRRAPWQPWSLGGWVPLYGFLSGLSILAEAYHHRWVRWIFFGTAIAVATGIALRDTWALRKRATDRFLVDGGFGDQFPAEITIVVEGRRIAADRGVVWFADGLMGFSGSSASFVLAASNLAPHYVKAHRPPKGQPVSYDIIALRGAPRSALVSVTPLFGHIKAYRKRLEAFMAADERPQGDRHWPPLEPYQAQKDLPQKVVRR